MSTPEIINQIADGLGVKPNLVNFPPALLKLIAEAAGQERLSDSLLRDLLIDASKSHRVLGLKPRKPQTIMIRRVMPPPGE
jgi:hypothetical protein